MKSRLTEANGPTVLLTSFSKGTFAWGYSGPTVVCLNSPCLGNSEKSFQEYWGPLSLITSDGIPCLANIGLVQVMAVVRLVLAVWLLQNIWSDSQQLSGIQICPM